MGKFAVIASIRLVGCSDFGRAFGLHTSLSVLLVVGPRPPVSYIVEYADGTYRRTDGRQTVTLRFLLVATSVIIMKDYVEKSEGQLLVGIKVENGYVFSISTKCRIKQRQNQTQSRRPRERYYRVRLL